MAAGDRAARRRLRGLQSRLSRMRVEESTADTAITTLQSQVAAMAAARPQLRHQLVTLPLIAIGSVDQTVNWPTPLPDAGYDVQVALGATLLGKASAGVKSKSAGSVTLTVTATIAVSAGATLHVVALWTW